MASWTIAALGGLALAWFSYRGPFARARAGSFALRAFALTIAIAMLLGAPAGKARAGRPFVVLDASASWRRGGDSASWQAAWRAARAARADTLWLAGDSLRAALAPELPTDLATRIAPAAARARASGRPLLLITDGEVDDAAAVGALPPGSRVEVPPRVPSVDAALIDLDAPPTVAAGDTIVARATLRAGDLPVPAASLTLRLDGRSLVSVRTEPLAARAEAVVALRAAAPSAPTRSLLSVVIDAPGDAEARNDTLTVALTVTRGAAVVFISTAPDEDVRALAPLLRQTLALPVRGFYRVAVDRWLREGTLGSATVEEVRAALRNAPVAILHGDTALLGAPRELTSGALLLWPESERAAGEWFAVAAPASPLAGAMAGTPWDSLPPLSLAERAPAGDWSAIDVARARRFDTRGAIAGTERGRRQVVAGASGFWRWRFRGGVAIRAPHSQRRECSAPANRSSGGAAMRRADRDRSRWSSAAAGPW